MLIVITIIAMLVAMLLPAIGKARESTIRMRCTNNLRLQAVAHSAYQGDNREYYPAFGGSVDYVASGGGAYITGGNWSGQFWYVPGVTSYFRDYLGGGSPATRKAQTVNYCPAVDWNRITPYVFLNPSYMTYFWDPNTLPGTHAGYSFYTGRKYWSQAGSFPDYNNYDTRPRRSDNRELLVSDLLCYVGPSSSVGSGTISGVPMGINISVPWFNPHQNVSTCTPTRSEIFYQLDATFAVKSSTFLSAVTTSHYNSQTMWLYGNTTSTSSVAGLTTTGLGNGHYWRVK